MSLTTCPDCGHPARRHSATHCCHWDPPPPCDCQRGSVAVFLPDDLDNMALRYAAARLELEFPPTTVAASVARFLRGLAR